MSTLEVNKITPSTGTSITLGDSGDTFTIPSGVTLTNNGTASGFGGITVADQWRLTADKTGLAGGQDITANLSQISSYGAGTIGTAMSESSGIFSFPSTGIYLITATAQFERVSGSANYMAFQMLATTDNSTYNYVADGGETLRDDPSSQGSVTISFMFDVTNTSTHKVKFRTDVSDAQTLKGSSTKNMTHFTFLRLGDT